MKTLHIKILLVIMIVCLIFITVIDPEVNILFNIIIFILVAILAVVDYRTNSVENIKKRSGKVIGIGILIIIVSTLLEALIRK